VSKVSKVSTVSIVADVAGLTLQYFSVGDVGDVGDVGSVGSVGNVGSVALVAIVAPMADVPCDASVAGEAMRPSPHNASPCSYTQRSRKKSMRLRLITLLHAHTRSGRERNLCGYAS
jgi:hypothetical protein